MRTALFILGTLLLAGFARAQTQQELDSQYQTLCAPAQLARIPDLKAQCDMMRTMLDSMRAPAAAPAATPAQAATRPADGSRVPSRAEQVDNTTQCACTRKLGRCSASARVIGAEITRLTTGLASRVVVRTEPPAGQCVEVTVFLQESAQLASGVNRRGHPLYQVIRGTNDVEWRNVGTSARRLDYSILSDETECFVCDAGKVGSSGTTDATDAQAARNEVREAMESEYRNCMAGTGMLYGQLDDVTRRQLCTELRKRIDAEPR